MNLINRQNLTRLAFIWVIYFMPILTFVLGMSYYNSVKLELQRNAFFSQSEQIAGEAPDFCSNQVFWTNLLIKISRESYLYENFKQNIEQQLALQNQKAAWVYKEENGPGSQIFFSENLQQYKNREWKKVLSLLNIHLRKGRSDLTLVQDNYVRKFFGPHLQLKKAKSMSTFNSKGLLVTDFMSKYPLFWAMSDRSKTIIVLLPPEVENKKQGVNEFLRRYQDRNKVFIVTPEKSYGNTSEFSTSQLQQLKRVLQNSSEKVLLFGKYLVYGETLPERNFLITAFKCELHDVAKSAMLMAVLLAFIFLIIFRSVSLDALTGRIKVKVIIFAFIGCSNILPLVILGFFAGQYLDQKRQVMIEEKRVEAVRFIRMIEDGFRQEVGVHPRKARKIFESYFDQLKNREMTLDTARKMHKELIDIRIDFNIISSQTMPILARLGFFTGKNFKILVDRDEAKDTPQKLVDLTAKIGGAFLSYWNQVTISQQTLTELELVSDMVAQKPIEQSMHTLVEIVDQIGNFGFGAVANPSIAMVFSINSPDKADYVAVFQMSVFGPARDYLNRIQPVRLANAYGMNVLFTNKNEYYDVRDFENFENPQEILKIFERLKDYPPMKAETTKIENKDFLYAGFRSNQMININMVAFYPLEEIHRKLKAEEHDLMKLFGVNLLTVILVSLFFAQNLLLPVKYLNEGTHAIDARDFSHRLPELGNDEFGRMAHIFNDALEDLQEMSVARVVQQSLFPSGKIETGCFELFGKSVTLADLGGDYFDYFEIDSEHFGAILGDVAGHGVGAAMIMAMAKSATLNLKDVLNQPIELTTRLHNLIYKTKTKKQKKIMTFQYLQVNKVDATVKYCNAGGCNPFLVNGKTAKVEEIILPAAALGAFKKGKFNEMNIEFEPGDVMVLYTDGIVEARNKAGEEIGYPRYKEILLKNWDQDPGVFYNNVVADYQEWLGSEPPQDDLTMIFLSLPVKSGLS